MRLRSWCALAARESRGAAGRLAFFTVCLAVGVAAVVSVSGLSQALDSGIQAQARQLLAADLALESRRTIPPEAFAAVDDLPGAAVVELRELPTMVSSPRPQGDPDVAGESLLAELKAVSPGYPFYGELVTAPAQPLTELLRGDRVLVAPELLARLDVAVGDDLRIGDASFVIGGTIEREPDRLGMSFTLGPRVLISMDGLARSGLTGSGSRINNRLLVRLAAGASADEVRAAAAMIRAALPDPEFVEVETYVEAQPSLRHGLERVSRYLGLVALLSLLVGGIGVAQAVRAWLSGRLDAIATLRALGVRPREAFALYLGQTVALGLLGSLLGVVAGSLVARAVPVLLQDLLPVRVEVGWQPRAMANGLALGVGVAVLFAMRPLLEVLRVPPVRVLRRDADPLPVNRGLSALFALALVAGVALIAALQSASVWNGAWFTAGLVAASAALAAAAWMAVRTARSVPRDFGPLTMRHGMAALARPGAGTLGAIVALGLGVLTVLGLYLVQDRLATQLDAELPSEAPSVFLVDIQPDQWGGVRDALDEAGASDVDSVEVAMARLRAIAGVPVAELVPRPEESEEAGRRRWVLTREQRLTSMTELPEGNVIVEGALWSVPDRAEVSIERDFAADLGVGIGDVITLDVQGVPVDLLVSSLRTVEWERFSINFFLVVEPGVLDDAPRFRVASARLSESAERLLQDRLAAAYPNVTLLRLRDVLERVVAILEQVGFGVRLLGAFTVLAGVMILGGAVSAGAVRRSREVALYKTLGMTRRQVVAAFAVEYALVGLVAGTIGSAGGVVLAWSVTRYGLDIAWAWTPGVYLFAVAAAVALTVLAGLAASVRALAVRPLAVLRTE